MSPSGLPLSDAEHATILLAGDIHGNEAWLEVLFDKAAEHRCDVLLQLGDFGYWTHTTDGVRFVRRAEFLAKRARIPLVWVDGNHENLAQLRTLPPRGDGFVELKPHVLHAPRGLRWRWAHTRFGALGGAFSIDHAWRTPGTSWWAEETITDEEVERLGREPLDVLVTHDAPAGVPIFGAELPAADEHRAYDNRRRVAVAVDNTSPALVVHGHWHHRYGYTLRNEASTRVEGLSSDQEGDGGAWAVLQLPTLAFTDGSTLTGTASAVGGVVTIKEQHSRDDR